MDVQVLPESEVYILAKWTIPCRGERKKEKALEGGNEWEERKDRKGGGE